MSIQGTQTERNLLIAFAGESQARNRYNFCASRARQEGYVQIAAVFEETANHEREHAQRLFSFLEVGEVTIEAAYPAGENHEHEEMYPEFARVAREEGFATIAAVFESIAIAEVYHEERFRALAERVENDRVFSRDESIVWRCRNCGYNHDGENALPRCPACAHAQAHFEQRDENW